MAIIRELFVKLGVKTDDKGLDDFDKKVERVKVNLGGLADFAKRAAAALAALGAVAVLQATQTAAMATEIERSARILGITTDEFQELTFAAEQFGLEAQDVVDAMATIADRANDAVAGTTSMADDFRLVGLSLDDLRGKNPAELFDTFADAIAATTDDGDRITSLVRTLGDDLGRKLGPALMGGAAGFRAMAREAHELGVVMDEDAIARAKEAGRAFKRFGAIVQGVRNEIGLALIPLVEQLTSRLGDFLRRNSQVIRLRLDRAMLRVGEAFEFVEGKLRSVDAFVKASLGGWENVFLRAQSTVVAFAATKAFLLIISLLSAIGSGVTFVAGTFGVGLLPAVAIIAAVAVALAGLALAIDDVITFMRGGESAFGDFIQGTGLAQDLFFALAEAVFVMGETIGTVLVPALQLLMALFQALSPVVLPIVTAFGELFGKGVLAGIRAFTAGIKLLGASIDHVLQTALDLFGLLKGDLSIGDAASRFGGRAGGLLQLGGESLAAQVLALPGLSATSGGARTDRFSSPTTTNTTTNTMGGDTINVYGMTTAELDNLQRNRQQTSAMRFSAVGAGAGGGF